MVVDTLFHVALFLLAFMLLFTVRKVVVRHHPTRLTNIPREHSETCQWLQLLCDGAFDIFATVFAEEVIAGLEHKVNAILEDKGIATRAVMKVHSIGDAPPHVKAIRGTLAPPSSSGKVRASSTATELLPLDQRGGGTRDDLSSPDIGPAQPPQPPGASPAVFLASSIHRMRHDAAAQTTGPLEIEFVCEYSGGASASLDMDVNVVRGRQLQVSLNVSELTLRAHCKVVVRLRGENDGGSDSSTASSPTLSGGDGALDPVLSAGSGGGSSPPNSAASTSASAAMLSPTPPTDGLTSSANGLSGRLVADVTLLALSEPAFSFELRTTMSKFGIHNFFGFATAAKYFILRWVRSKLMTGIRFDVPLPADWAAPTAHQHHHHHQPHHQHHHHQRQHHRVGSSINSSTVMPGVRSEGPAQHLK